MENKIKDAFDCVRADEALVENTAARISREMAGRRRTPPVFPVRRYAAAFAFLLALVVSVGGFRVYSVADSHINIEVNPAVELSVNRWDRVVGTFAYNAEGEQLLSGLRLYGKPYDAAAGQILSAMESGGYFTGDALVSVTVQSGGERREAQLYTVLEEQVQAALTDGAAEVSVISEEILAGAHGCHMGPAKYLAILELMEVDPAATPEQYSHHSIQEIRGQTQQHRSGHMQGGGGNRQKHGKNRHDR